MASNKTLGEAQYQILANNDKMKIRDAPIPLFFQSESVTILIFLVLADTNIFVAFVIFKNTVYGDLQNGVNGI